MSSTSIELAPDATPHEAVRPHYYVIEFYTADGRRLGPTPIEPDFQPAREFAFFDGVRRGLLDPVTIPARGVVEPVWSDELGSPYCEGIRVFASDDGTVSSVVSKDYFSGIAGREIGRWIERGDLKAGENFKYRLCAYPLAAQLIRSSAGSGLQVEGIAEPIAMTTSDLDPFLSGANACGDQDECDATVLLPQEVIDETCGLAADAGEIETGGVLVGRLHRDIGRPDVFIEIAAQIPAKHAEASGASFEFTPETWAAAHAAIELRGGEELICGWWHSHPKFCRNCPSERQRDCVLARPFFSSDDIHLHQTCFGRAYQLALLISDLPHSGPTPALYGWRNGTVVSRGFHAVRRRH